MRLSELTAVAMFTAAIGAETDASTCEAVSTVYVTVSGPPTIETFNLIDASSAIISTASSVEAQPYIWTGVAAAGTSIDTTAAVTSYLTYTEVFSVIEGPTTSATADQGSYYFTKENGTTVWLGDKTPPVTDALVTGTTTVVVEPTPGSVFTSSDLTTSGGVATSSGVSLPNPTSAVPEAPAAATSFSTVFLTIVTTEQATETITETTYTAPTSTRTLAGLEAPAANTSFSTVFWTIVTTEQVTETLTETTYTVPRSTRILAGLGSSGWNTSLTTLQTIKAGPTASRVSNQWSVQKGVPHTIVHSLQSGYSYSLSGSAASGYVSKNKVERQLGAIVYANINGVAVSWTNDYDGGSNPTSTTSTSATPAPVASPYGFSLTVPVITPATYAPVSTVVPVSSSESPSISGPVPLPSSISFGGAAPLGPPSVHPLSSATTAVGSASFTSFTSLAATPPSSSTVTSIGSPTTVTEGLIAVSSTAAVSSEVVTTPRFSNASATTSAAAATSSCPGQFGHFTITFDDLPTFGAGPNNTDYPPLFSPYHDLFWSQGFAYAPPPSDPFLPISSPQLAIFIVNASANVHSIDSSGGGGFSAGLNIAESAFWVDAYGAYLGCNDGGPVECIVNILGYVYSSATDNPDPSFRQTVTLPPCPGLVNCTLTPVTFTDDFRSLTGLEFIATIGGTPVTWFMDDLQLGWSNNTCAAGLRRDTLPL
ncbi:MAG: hypothetical protein FRX48_02366 [Lasallia pustulata]|uniref:DUF7371 domain-containing protein n=1 Tax=Lasallia pustulata TaxID=136370 RepID=A0A5M8PY45_9LECA|nr:MAG: hypothetical protein FRX48_02366 [Lasallia pustulata]